MKTIEQFNSKTLENLEEIAKILATGFIRHMEKQEAESTDNSVDSTAVPSIHAQVQ